MHRLSKLRTSIEVAADTLHPAWRQLLAAVGHSTERKYSGHPYDWVVRADNAAAPLASTYQQWDPDFSFQHLEECMMIGTCWPGRDPRRVHTRDIYICSECGGTTIARPPKQQMQLLPVPGRRVWSCPGSGANGKMSLRQEQRPSCSVRF